MPHLPTELLNNFQELIYRQCSLRFSPSRLINLEMQLLERVKTRELPSYEDYFQLLQDDLKEFDALIEGITTKETHFFRLPEQFKALEKEVIPRIEERLSNDAQRLIEKEGWPGSREVPFRIWSAGCATGEEPYSIAMTLMDSLRYPRSRNLDVQKGRTCTFIKPDGNSEDLDLLERLDMIFCRNVMIYFDFAAQQQLVENLYACLKPGGYLFAGDAELLGIYKHDFETLDFEGAYFYRKPEIEEIQERAKQNG
ncbi:MAG: CheR family methyltransferase [bacterium]